MKVSELLREAAEFTNWLKWIYTFGPWKDVGDIDYEDPHESIERFAKQHNLDPKDVARYEWDSQYTPSLSKEDYEAHKDEIIHCLLHYLKETSDGTKEMLDYHHHLRLEIKHARSVGINWPELKAIEKSLV